MKSIIILLNLISLSALSLASEEPSSGGGMASRQSKVMIERPLAKRLLKELMELTNTTATLGTCGSEPEGPVGPARTLAFFEEHREKFYQSKSDKLLALTTGHSIILSQEDPKILELMKIVSSSEEALSHEHLESILTLLEIYTEPSREEESLLRRVEASLTQLELARQSQIEREAGEIADPEERRRARKYEEGFDSLVALLAADRASFLEKAKEEQERAQRLEAAPALAKEAEDLLIKRLEEENIALILPENSPDFNPNASPEQTIAYLKERPCLFLNEEYINKIIFHFEPSVLVLSPSRKKIIVHSLTTLLGKSLGIRF